VSHLFLVFPCSFPFLSFFVSLSGLCCGVCFLPVVWLSLPVASGIAAETQFAGWCLSQAFTHCRELMKSVGSCDS
jgi:hypothetical protein